MLGDIRVVVTKYVIMLNAVAIFGTAVGGIEGTRLGIVVGVSDGVGVAELGSTVARVVGCHIKNNKHMSYNYGCAIITSMQDRTAVWLHISYDNTCCNDSYVVIANMLIWDGRSTAHFGN